SRARRGRRGAQSSDERRERDRRREDGQVDVPVGDGRDRLVVEGDQPEDRQERGGEDPGGEEPCAASGKEREEEEDGDREEAVPAKAGLREEPRRRATVVGGERGRPGELPQVEAERVQRDEGPFERRRREVDRRAALLRPREEYVAGDDEDPRAEDRQRARERPPEMEPIEEERDQRDRSGGRLREQREDEEQGRGQVVAEERRTLGTLRPGEEEIERAQAEQRGEDAAR